MKNSYLYATDGSDPARRGERYIRTNLDPQRDAITVVSVTEELPPGFLKEGESLTVEPATIRNELTDTVREIAEEARARLADEGFDVDVALLAGDPGEEICEYAEKTGADGIILGRRGHREVTELLIGSVSQYIVHHASVPVVLVPASFAT